MIRLFTWVCLMVSEDKLKKKTAQNNDSVIWDTVFEFIDAFS